MDTIFRVYQPEYRNEPQQSFVIQMASEQEANEKHTEKAKPASPQKTGQPQGKSAVSEKGEKLKKDLDKIMDEIDDVLEENAEEFIKSYVQRGGE